MTKSSYIPEGSHNVTPSLSFKGTEAAIVWYTKVFGAKEKARMENPDKTIMHAELTIGDSSIFLAEEDPKYNNKSAKSVNGNSIKLYAYVPDVDETIDMAVQNGGTVVMSANDMFYGDRVGCIDDPFGYTWVLATHIKDVSEEEVHRQMEEMTHN